MANLMIVLRGIPELALGSLDGAVNITVADLRAPLRHRCGGDADDVPVEPTSMMQRACRQSAPLPLILVY